MRFPRGGYTSSAFSTEKNTLTRLEQGTFRVGCVRVSSFATGRRHLACKLYILLGVVNYRVGMWDPVVGFWAVLFFSREFESTCVVLMLARPLCFSLFTWFGSDCTALVYDGHTTPTALQSITTHHIGFSVSNGDMFAILFGLSCPWEPPSWRMSRFWQKLKIADQLLAWNIYGVAQWSQANAQLYAHSRVSRHAHNMAIRCTRCYPDMSPIPFGFVSDWEDSVLSKYAPCSPNSNHLVWHIPPAFLGDHSHRLSQCAWLGNILVVQCTVLHQMHLLWLTQNFRQLNAAVSVKQHSTTNCITWKKKNSPGFLDLVKQYSYKSRRVRRGTPTLRNVFADNFLT